MWLLVSECDWSARGYAIDFTEAAGLTAARLWRNKKRRIWQDAAKTQKLLKVACRWQTGIIKTVGGVFKKFQDGDIYGRLS